MALLRDYIAYSRAHCKPQLTDAAVAELVEGYLNMRRQGISRKVRLQWFPSKCMCWLATLG